MRYLLSGFGVILLIPPFIAERHNTPFIYTAGYTFFYIGSGLILIALIDKGFKTSLLTRTAASIDFYSYSIYLWHLPLSRLSAALSRRLPASHGNWLIYAVVYLLAAILGGIFMATIIEIPLLGLRDRLFPSISSPFTNGHACSKA